MNDLKASDLAGFTGSETWYKIGFTQILMTDGAKYVADHGGAYWLMDKIAFAQFEKKYQRQPFQVWTLRKASQLHPLSAVLTCEDGNRNIVSTQLIEFTDFPLVEITLWFENKTIFLPSER